MTWYGDHDKYVCQWLRNLIAAGHLPPGDVDGRSIKEVSGEEVQRYTQAHFFAGIGGWPLALRLAGWLDDRPVWTGSCPCQPFSAAGNRKGEADERHLWPDWFRLICECRPGVIFGEQVPGAIRLGWLDRVFADLEGEGYACGAVVLGAHSVGAPHIRHRIFWVADRDSKRFQIGQEQGSEEKQRREQTPRRTDASGCCGPGELADTESYRAARDVRDGEGPSGQTQEDHGGWRATLERLHGPICGSAHRYSLIPCRDGKARRIEPGLQPLAHGVPCRMGKLRAYGNAIVPQVAAAFVKAYMEAVCQ